MKVSTVQDSSLSEALSSLDVETLRRLELHLDTPYGKRMPSYGNDLARREDLLARTEALWSELSRSLIRVRSAASLLQSSPSRTTWAALQQARRTEVRVYREFCASRFRVLNC